MDRTSQRWHQITESEFPWEREALDYVRERLPDRDPVTAWANFEFITDGGQVYEVDLLVVTARGMYLIEIKSWPGVLGGDAGTWVNVRPDGRRRRYDHPLKLANRKAKALRSLLDRQRAAKAAKGRLPFIQAGVFLSHPGLVCRLQPDGRAHTYAREHDDLDEEARAPGIEPLPGMVTELVQMPSEEYARAGRRVDRPTAKVVARALEEAGVRRSVKRLAVGDWQLGDLLVDGPGYQDFVATHTQLADQRRRIRIYGVFQSADDDLRRTVNRAAEREYRLLSQLRHDSILAVHDFTTASELGPALVFDHLPDAVRLDEYLAEHGDTLDVETRLHLVRAIAEAIGYAHSRRVVHRALSPMAIQVVDPDDPFPGVRVHNWQTGLREGAGTDDPDAVTATVHVDRLVEDEEGAYMAPESLGADAGPEADVFSLGAIAYHVFSGHPPATSMAELVRALAAGPGLQVEAVLDAAPQALRDLVRYATHPEVPTRTESVDDFLEGVAKYEEELTRPEEPDTVEPRAATGGDLLPGGSYMVVRRLGQGSSAVAFEVAVDEESVGVLKIGLDAADDERLAAEAEVLARDELRHPGIVRLVDVVDVGGRTGLLMRSAGERTLAQAIREEGQLGVDRLATLGDDLLAVVEHLEHVGIAHRDIKPANLGVGPRGKDDRVALTLFDFSLSQAPREDIEAGTRPYLEPYLPLRTPTRWDERAERFAAAVTLYEMATGVVPRFGDGQSDPAATGAEAVIEQERFDPSLAPGLARFFTTALAPDPERRFETPRQMREAWAALFAEGPAEEPPGTATLSIGEATLESAIRDLGPRAEVVSALERAGITDVGELLEYPIGDLVRLRGVGSRVRREIVGLAKELRERFPDVRPAPEEADERAGLDAVVASLTPRSGPAKGDGPVIRALLALDADAIEPWPSLAQAAVTAGVPREEVTAVVNRARERWRKAPALTSLTADVRGALRQEGSVATVDELAALVLSKRGALSEDDDERFRLARAAIRAVVERERGRRREAIVEHRAGDAVILATDQPDGAQAGDLIGYAAALGEAADDLASTDPLLSPDQVQRDLGLAKEPEDMVPLTRSRRVRLAAATSSRAAASPRLELYPRGMDAGRALKLSATAMVGGALERRTDQERMVLRVKEIRRRVRARYPEAAPLPDRPALDDVISDLGLGLRWDDAWGAYLFPPTDASQTAHSTSFRPTTGATPARRTAAEAFEARLARSSERGGFLALATERGRLARAERALDRDGVTVVDMDAVLIDAMRRVADDMRVDWEVVRKADEAGTTGAGWGNLLRLVDAALPVARKELVATGGLILVTRLGLLARYDRLRLIEDLREDLARGPVDGLCGMWVLAAGADHGGLPTVDGVPVPTLTPDQRAVIPGAWLAEHGATA